ncbi:MAG: CHAT domain-containing protein [Treponema sp.]|nr:CHAT domain-containing protein [Treponema sp.]
MKKLFYTCILFSLIGSMAFPKANASKNTKSYVALAKEALKKGNLDDGLDYLYLAMDDDDPEAYILMGDQFLQGDLMYQDFDEATVYYEIAIDILEENKDISSEKYFMALLGLGQTVNQSGDYTNAMGFFKNALTLSLNLYGEQALNTARCYLNLGKTYSGWGDTKQARTYFDKALKIALEEENGLNNTVAECYNSIAYLLLKMEKYNECETYFSKAMEIYEKLYGTQSLEITDCLTDMANLCIHRQDLDTALSYANKALKIQLQNLGDFNTHTAKTYSTIAQIYDMNNDVENAVENYTSALDIQIEIYGQYHPEVAKAFFNLGMMCYRGKLYSEAKKALESAFLIYEHTENYTEIMEKAWTVFTNIQYVPKKYQDDFLFIKLDALAAGINAAENARNSITSKKDNITAKALPLYYAAVDLYAQSFEEKNSFYYSELLRSRGFLEEIGTEAALKLDGVTDKEREQFKQLSKEIDQLSKKVMSDNSKKSTSSDANEVSNNEEKLNAAREKLAALDESIGKRLPKYSQLRNPTPVTFDEAKKWCGKNRVILEYVMWDESYADSILNATIEAEELNVKSNSKTQNLSNIASYCLVISSRKVVPVKLDSTYDYTQSIEKIRKMITDRTPLNDKNFTALRKELYDKLIAPVYMSLPLMPDNIMIVPDGNLSFLPFDVLCDDDGIYLGELYNLSVSPSVSVSMMAEKNGGTSTSSAKTSSNKTKNSFENDDHFLAVGNPLYNKSDSAGENRGFQKKFIKLENKVSQEELLSQYAKPETAGKYFQARNISWSNIPGTGTEIHTLKEKTFQNASFKLVEGKEASEKAIKTMSQSKELEKYSIVHFACHGYFDTQNYQMSSIVFSEVSSPLEQRGDDDGYMTLSEASLLNLNANLVNLSACQTGLAQLRKGEGMTGLTRSFLVAGARNVGVTLWSVDDEATCEFMTRMYSKVKDFGYTYREAYAEVKNEFRKDSKLSAPYYWAAFILYE